MKIDSRQIEPQTWRTGIGVFLYLFPDEPKTPLLNSRLLFGHLASSGPYARASEGASPQLRMRLSRCIESRIPGLRKRDGEAPHTFVG
jgi:hypothetical protein